MSKMPFRVGDIIQHKNGCSTIVCDVSTDDGTAYCFSSTATYEVDEYDYREWKKIGTYDLSEVASAIATAEENAIDIQTQVNMALSLMDKTFSNCTPDSNDKVLVGNDIRVRKEDNKVYIQVYPAVGSGYEWQPVVKFRQKYGISDI